MHQNNQNKLMMNNIINWLYITGSGLTVTGIIKNHDEINLQTKVGISILTIALIIDKLFL